MSVTSPLSPLPPPLPLSGEGSGAFLMFPLSAYAERGYVRLTCHSIAAICAVLVIGCGPTRKKATDGSLESVRETQVAESLASARRRHALDSMLADSVVTNHKAEGLAANDEWQTEWTRRWDSLTSSPPWYREERHLDVTGDGRPDLIVLEARGDSASDLLVGLYAVVDGENYLLSRWTGAYELTDPPFARDTIPTVINKYIRDAFARTLASVNVGERASSVSFSGMDPGSHADTLAFLHEESGLDSTNAEVFLIGLRRRAFPTIGYSYGYESVVDQVWVPALRRFIEVAACC